MVWCIDSQCDVLTRGMVYGQVMCCTDMSCAARTCHVHTLYGMDGMNVHYVDGCCNFIKRTINESMGDYDIALWLVYRNQLIVEVFAQRCRRSSSLIY